MSLLNYTELNVTIEFKNKRKLIVHTSFEADRPLDEARFHSENISSGPSLFIEIYKAYNCYFDVAYDKWDSFGDIYDQHEELAKAELERITDLAGVKEITIKEKFCWEWDECWTKVITINSVNCPHIIDDPIEAKSESLPLKYNMPVSLTSIGRDAFRGCNNFVMNVQTDTYAHQYAQKYGLAHNIVD